MSENLMRVQLNTLKILEWEPGYPTYSDENPSPELLLQRLCALGVPSDMPAFRKRYVEVSEYDRHLSFAIDEPTIRENLYGPLCQAKMNYILGNYVSSIALCGIVAEMIAILIYVLKKPSRTKLKGFERKRQHERIDILRRTKLIDQQSENDFNTIKGRRNSLLHCWKTPDKPIDRNAVQVYAATARLAYDTFFVKEFRDGKATLRSGWMEYLEERGAFAKKYEGE